MGHLHLWAIVVLVLCLLAVDTALCRPAQAPRAKADPPRAPPPKSPYHQHIERQQQFNAYLDSLDTTAGCQSQRECEACVASRETYGHCGWYAPLKRCVPGDALGALDPTMGPMFFLSCESKPGRDTTQEAPKLAESSSDTLLRLEESHTQGQAPLPPGFEPLGLHNDLAPQEDHQIATTPAMETFYEPIYSTGPDKATEEAIDWNTVAYPSRWSPDVYKHWPPYVKPWVMHHFNETTADVPVYSEIVWTTRGSLPTLPKVESEEVDEIMRIAYIILVHNEDSLRGAGRILRRLYAAKHTFIIHVDKSPGVEKNRALDLVFSYFTLEQRQAMLSQNVLVLAAFDLRWATLSIIEAELALIKMAVELDRRWSYSVLLSGHCYPVTSPANIEATLTSLRGPKQLRDSFNFSSYDVPIDPDALPKPNALFNEATARKDPKSLDWKALMSRETTFSAYWEKIGAKVPWVNLFAGNGLGGNPMAVQFLFDNMCISVPERSAPICIQNFNRVRMADPKLQKMAYYMHSGTQWFTISRPMAVWLSKSPAVVEDLLAVVAMTPVPDEIFFATLAFMTPWRSHSLWYPARLPMPTRGERWDRPKCGPHPCFLTAQDVNRALQDRPLIHFGDERAFSLFARKFDTSDDTLYNIIDQNV